MDLSAHLGDGGPVLSALLEVVVPVFAIAGVGFVYAARNPFPVHVMTDLIIHVTGACLVFDALSSGEQLTLDAARAPISAVLVIAGGIGLAFGARWLAPGLRSLHPGAVALPIAFMNAGNLGLPMAKLALGQSGFEAAMLFFVTFNVLMLTVGIGLVAGRQAAGIVLRFPLLYATILGLFVNQTGLSMPMVIEIPVHMLAETVIPMMLFALGARLRGLAEQRGVAPPFAVIAGLVGLRMVGGVGIAVVVNAVLQNHGDVHDITLLSGFLPPAVMNFAFVEKFADDPYASAVVSAAIAVGTGLALVALPIWVTLVQ